MKQKLTALLLAFFLLCVVNAQENLVKDAGYIATPEPVKVKLSGKITDSKTG